LNFVHGQDGHKGNTNENLKDFGAGRKLNKVIELQKGKWRLYKKLLQNGDLIENLA